MEDGANATFTAVWVDAPAGCRLDPAWYRWSVANGTAGGSIDPTNGSETQLASPQVGVGISELVVRSAATESCGSNETAVLGNASVNVSLTSPVEVVDPEVEPDPIALGGAAQLIGSVGGGLPPYRLQVSWGDGNTTGANLTDAGPFDLVYRYPANGTFSPALTVTDSDGRTAEGAPVEPAHVGSGFDVAIDAPGGDAEVGVPVTFTVGLLHPPSNFSTVYWCDDASSSAVDDPDGLVFTCTFGTPGTFQVGFEAAGTAAPYPSTSATRNEPIVPGPNASIAAPPPVAEVGRPVSIGVDLWGGDAPYSVRWSLVGTNTSGLLTANSTGTVDVSLVPTAPGSVAFTAVATDALGVTTPAVSVPLTVAPPAVLHANAAAELTNGSVRFSVGGSVVQGAGPYDWAVVPALGPANGSNLTGTLSGPGEFGWNASYVVEGPIDALVAVIDGTGAELVDRVEAQAVVPLSIDAAAEPTGPGEVNLTLTVSGGVAPYVYRWDDCEATSGNGSAIEPGTIDLREATTTDGECRFDVSVVDAFGRTAQETLWANLTAPAEPPLPTVPRSDSDGTVAGVVALVAAVGAGAFLLRRRRPALPSTPPPEPVGVLREIISASDGVDRGLVELLAEEQGLSPETVRSTLERLKADGTVRSGRGVDGEEVLAWSPSLLP